MPKSIDFAACGPGPCFTSKIRFAVHKPWDSTGQPIVGYGVGSSPVVEVSGAGRHSLKEISGVPAKAWLPMRARVIFRMGLAPRRAA